MRRTLLLSAALLLLASGGRAESVRLPNGDDLREIDFERHVVALLGRAGCNAGSCHGSFQGKGGFRLSLFSHDPALDYRSLTRDSLGRRTNPNDPDRSLLLLKPTAAVPHEGGRRFAPGSWQYRVLREWIAAGRTWRPGSAAIRRLDINPGERLLQPGETIRLRVLAEF
ncbi:MAG TPA: S-layer related protein (Precursor), partial [Gemmataceae bacterium]|nr:S-layer related protein (Precursor) [Gemmataceae bacterium]